MEMQKWNWTNWIAGRMPCRCCLPDCGCAILLRPTKSLTLYIQQAMWCMRYKEGTRAVILDHVGNVRRFGMCELNAGTQPEKPS